jgi:beta-1,4-mannosyltransferase
LGINKSDTIFVYFGGIRPNKGIDRLIEAFSRLPDKDIRLVIAGKPSPPVEYFHRVHYLVSQDQRIHLIAEFIPENEIQIYLNAADVVVLPFERILSSGSVMLALSFGKPVIAPTLGCLTELITSEVGILYDPSYDRGLYDALCLSLDLDIVAMGGAAYLKAKEFSWQQTAKKTLVAYGFSQS